MRTLVAYLTDDSELPARKVFLSRTYSEKGVAEFRSPAQQLLFSLLPRIREIDPQWADQLLENEPALRQAATASGEATSSEQLMIVNTGNVPASEIEKLQTLEFERQKLTRASRLASTDPTEALTLIRSITNAALRNQGLAFVAATLSKTDPAEAQSLLGQVTKSVDSLPVAADRLSVLAALAKASAARNNQDLFKETSEHGFDLGEELFSQDSEIHPGKGVEDVTGFTSLASMVATGMEFQPAGTVSRINQITNHLLRAHLLRIAAEELVRLQRAGSPVTAN
jgi:hypothetical protein